MTNRDWFCLALRLLGIWLLIRSVESIIPNLIFLLMGTGPNWDIQWGYFFATVLWLFCRTGFALILIVFAPAFASRFYSSQVPQVAEESVNEVHALRIGLQLIAIYAILLSLQSASNVIYGILTGEDFSFSPDLMFAFDSGASYLANLLNFGFNLAFACVLLMWNEGIVAFITEIRYVAERDAYEPPPLEE